MNSILYIKPNNVKKVYSRHNIINNIIDKLKINVYDDIYLKELKLNILKINFPMNINLKSYNKNMIFATKGKKKSMIVAPKVWRKVDYKNFSLFQKDLFAYSLYKSIQLILRLKNKSIRSSCIVICDPVEFNVLHVAKYIFEQSKYIVFLTKDLKKACIIRDYIVSEYGISPIVTLDTKYAFKCADFMILSKSSFQVCDVPTWYLDNLCKPNNNVNINVNDVCYNTQWGDEFDNMSIELLGAILQQMDEKNVEKSLKYNGISISKILFNDKEINLI